MPDTIKPDDEVELFIELCAVCGNVASWRSVPNGRPKRPLCDEHKDADQPAAYVARIDAFVDVPPPGPLEPFLPMNAELFGAIWDILSGSPGPANAAEESAFERRARRRLLDLMPGPDSFPAAVDRASYDLAQGKALIDSVVPNTLVDHAALDEWAKNTPPRSFATDAEEREALTSGGYPAKMRAEHGSSGATVNVAEHVTVEEHISAAKFFNDSASNGVFIAKPEAPPASRHSEFREVPFADEAAKSADNRVFPVDDPAHDALIAEVESFSPDDVARLKAHAKSRSIRVDSHGAGLDGPIVVATPNGFVEVPPRTSGEIRGGVFFPDEADEPDPSRGAWPAEDDRTVRDFSSASNADLCAVLASTRIAALAEGEIRIARSIWDEQLAPAFDEAIKRISNASEPRKSHD